MPTRRSVLLAAVAAVTGAGVASCSSASNGSSGSSGSGSSSSGASASGGAGASPTAATFPVTVTHAFGTTTISQKPARVATVGWANHEVPLSLGIVPVGMAKATWGDDDTDGILPWVKEKITALGGATPVLFDETDSIDFEAVGNTTPDVILAAYSGLTQADYDKLSKIAPVVAYPKTPWTTTPDQMIELNAAGLGLAGEGAALVSSLKEQVAAAVAKHPTLKGKTALFAFIDPKDLSKISYYTTGDPRAAYLQQLGLGVPQLVAGKAGATTFFQELSAEQVDQLSDVDLIVTYGDAGGSLLKSLQASALLSKIPAVASGAVAVLPTNTPVAACANPSPLDIPWGVEKYLAVLETAAAKAK